MNNSPQQKLQKKQQGVALLSVLLILVVVTLALTQIQNASRQDLERIEGRYLQQQGWAYLLGAETLGRQVLTDGRIREQPRWWASLRGEPVSYPVDEGILSLRVMDLRSCFNLNHLAGISSQDASHSLPELLPWRLYLNQLQEEERWLPDLEPDAFMDLARDWMDRDNEALPQGAETGQYLLEDPPRVAANQPMADLSEVNWLQPQQRQRFRQLPSSLCLLPDSRLRLNINTLNFENLGLLWALMEGQVSRQALEDWWSQRPEVGYQQLDDFWAELGEHQLPDDPAWKQRVGAQLMFVSDYYRMTIEMRLNDLELVFESDIYLSPQGQTRVYARRRGPVDGHTSLIDAGSREE
ncbi:MAG: type II secretion system minor pseudopilin GspK [Marinospirillum sp.]|uniref:type II secretion system minor pseudopilin GspK n=1 Tax=Marinospirillum sp. TaxID=2183934 RepID=UPI001A00AB82|nr:type II secretion system minor pseudopilin GspK [Marinospirillum sp.]MBE0505860.1 type II secretion system minor pseudopilin GspK [Marinospirillum sp.]